MLLDELEKLEVETALQLKVVTLGGIADHESGRLEIEHP